MNQAPYAKPATQTDDFSFLRLLRNVIWIIIALPVVLEWVCTGIGLCVTIIGIPAGLQCFKVAQMLLNPFAYEIVYKKERLPEGTLYLLLNIVWICSIGLLLALSHLFLGVMWCLTIIGIPFGGQHFRLAVLAFVPFGASLVYRPE